MGVLQTWLCAGCGYGATVSGGYSLNKRAQTRTVSCATCREIEDVVVRSFELGNFPPPEHRDDEVGQEAPPRCPENPGHDVEPWDAGGACPRCGEAMQAGEGFILCD